MGRAAGGCVAFDHAGFAADGKTDNSGFSEFVVDPAGQHHDSGARAAAGDSVCAACADAPSSRRAAGRHGGTGSAAAGQEAGRAAAEQPTGAAQSDAAGRSGGFAGRR